MPVIQARRVRRRSGGLRTVVFLGATVFAGWLAWAISTDDSPSLVQATVSNRTAPAAYDVDGIDAPSSLTDSASISSEVKDAVKQSTNHPDPFHPVSFILPPPPPPPVVASVPAKPTAPSFPYRYFGRVATGVGETFYLVRDDTLIPIAPAQVLDNVYRIDSVTPSEIRITYLPLHETTILSLPVGG